MHTSVAIDEVTGLSERTLLQRILANQAFWVTVAVALICLATAWQEPRTFPTLGNFFNITRNFAAIGIMALGMTAVIITGGIDLSVGSVVVLSGMVAGMTMAAGHSIWIGAALAIGAALLVGLVNGALIAYVRMPPFVVTLGMLSLARSLAMVLSDNKMVYQFGPDHAKLLWLGGGSILGVPNPLIVLAILALITGFAFNWTAWGRHVFAIGGNEQAATLTGVPVTRIKISVYMFAALTAGITGVLEVGWLGGVTTNLGQGMELTVIAAAVIGGANLSGGIGTAFGAVIGAALIEVIRNSLILLGISTFWQGAFVGSFIILAVLFDRIRAARANA
jgi:ribose transport system permease protein